MGTTNSPVWKLAKPIMQVIKPDCPRTTALCYSGFVKNSWSLSGSAIFDSLIRTTKIMHVLIRGTLYSVMTTLLIMASDAGAMTETIVAPSSHSAVQRLMINTLLIGASIPFFQTNWLDPEYFRNKEPASVSVNEDDENDEDEPFWLWLLKQVKADPSMSENEVAELAIKKRLTEAGLDDLAEYETPDQNLTLYSPSTEHRYIVPGIYNYGGGDSENDQKNGSDNKKFDDKDAKEEENTSDDDNDASSSASAASTSSQASALTSLEVMDETLRPQVVSALKEYKTEKDNCKELEAGGYSRIHVVTKDGITLVIKDPCMPPRDDFKNDEEYEKEKQRLLNMSSNEKDMLLRLQHENVIKLIAYMVVELPEAGKAFLLVMEYGGEELYHYLRKSYRAIRQHLRFIAQNILYGLTYLERQGLVWGDLKSDNVMLYEHSHTFSVRLVDLATCQTPEQRALLMLDDIYSREWLAPELFPFIEGMTATAASDMYCFGLICAMLSGIHRHGSKEVFKKTRRKEPSKVNAVLLSAMEDSIKQVCGLTDEQSACARVPEKQAVKVIKTDKTFLHLMAIFATRPAEQRPNPDIMQQYFDIYEQR